MGTRKKSAKRKSRARKIRRVSQKARRILRSRTKIQRPPRTAKQYFAMSRKDQDFWDRLVQVPARVRDGRSLPEAAKEFGISPSQVLHRIPSAFRKVNGRYVARASDRLLKILVIPSKNGLIEIAVRDSRQASLVGKYWSVLHHYLSTGNDVGMKKFKTIRIIDANGNRVRLLTDLDEINRQASAGILRFESIYGRTV